MSDFEQEFKIIQLESDLRVAYLRHNSLLNFLEQLQILLDEDDIDGAREVLQEMLG